MGLPLVLASAALVLAACAGPGKLDATSADAAYFDPHTHLSGVLPWQAHANLPAYLDALQQAGEGVSDADKLDFYRWLATDWYASQKDKLGDGPFASSQRVDLGARATLELFDPGTRELDRATVDGALKCLYTAHLLPNLTAPTLCTSRRSSGCGSASTRVMTVPWTTPCDYHAAGRCRASAAKPSGPG